jgi:heme A synthase
MKHLLLQVALLAYSFGAIAQTAHPRTTHKKVTPHVAAKVKVKTKHATGPSVYYCASGNTVKYHASPGCRGLARCNAAVVPMALAAVQQRMDPCKWCY